MRWVVLALAVAVCATGCTPLSLRNTKYPNPALVPPLDRDFVWDQLVDVVDDYFEIEREQRVRQMGDVLTVGRLDTFPVVGATYLEPWRGDSANPYERLESTLQTIRRRAIVQVVPAPEGYAIDVAVYKELEDLARPEYSTAGAATFRHDQSIERTIDLQPVDTGPNVAGWIPQGRDCALEQKILGHLIYRLKTRVPQSAPCPPAWKRWLQPPLVSNPPAQPTIF